MRSNGKGNRLIDGRPGILGAVILFVLLSGLFVISFATRAAMVTKIWDGGGATNNWSEATNWSGDAVPGPADDVVFDATSVKDVTIDVNINVGSIKIDTGYPGTITQSDSAAITVSGCSGRPCYLQNSGTFNGSSNTITLNTGGFGSLTMSGGTFNGGRGDILLGGASSENPGLSVQGGTFKSTSGKLTTAGSIVTQGTSSFQNNGGTVTLTASGPFQGIIGDSNHLSITFNDLNVDLADGAAILVGPRVIVAGNLALNNGTLNQNGSVIEARSGLSIPPSFDGGVISLELANGTGPRTFTFTPDLNLPKIVVSDPNVTINTSGSSTVTFPHQLILSAGVFNQGSVDLTINSVGVGGGFCYVQNGGTFNASSNTITANANGFGAMRINGGVFNGGSGDINLVGAPSDNAELSLQGGTFKSTSGNLTVPGIFRFQGVGTALLHNGGTVTLSAGQGGFLVADSNHPTINFNNLNLSPSNGVNYDFGARAVVEGTLALNDGRIGQGNNGTVIEARRDLSVSPNFDGGIGAVEFANGAGSRTFTFATGLSLPMIVVNDSNVTINTSGVGTLSFAHELILRQGVVNQGNVDLLVDSQGFGNTSYQQTGGTFNGSSDTITIHSVGFGSVTMDGGAFNGGTGDISLTGDPGTNAGIVNRGGAFKSTSGNLTIGGNFILQNASSSFDPNNGTVTFVSNPLADIVGDSFHPTITFNNVNVTVAPGAFIEMLTNMVVNGNLQLNDGRFTSFGSVTANGNVTVGAGFDGSDTGLPFRFGGSANQAFTNLGGVNPQGTWTVNKPTGIVTATTSLILQPTQQLNITSGTLFLGNGSDLTAGPITIGAPGKLVADSSQTITLGGNLSNSGVIDLQGGGAGCPESDTIVVRSSSPSTQRNWTGIGAFRLVDVDIQDQAGTAPVTVFSGTNGGNLGANFTFNSGCPTALSISPLTTGAVTGTSFQFIAGGGIGTRTFSLVVNNSGGSIVFGNGQYTAGPIPDVTDTIRVTDSLGSFTDATVNVTGPGSKLRFIQQPTDSAAGSSISPPIQVAIQDQAGVTVTTATNTIVITISNNPGGGTLTGTASKAAVGGIATFNNLSINQIASGYTLRAGANSLTPSISTSFNITAGAPASLQFTVQPQNVVAGAFIAPPVQVAIKDGLGNIVTTASNPITISIGNNPGGSALTGTPTIAAVNGIATFDDLSLNNPGDGYTLSATSSSLNGTVSTSFNVINPFAVTNVADSGAGSLREAINTANATPGTQTISFNIPGPSLTIEVTSNLPAITDSVVIDGTTQPGYAGVPLVELNGWRIFTGNSIGLRFTAGGNTLKGLAVNGFLSGPNSGIGLSFEGPGSNTIEGDYIGVRVGPLNNPDRNKRGLLLSSSNNRVTGNVITDDDFGILLDGLSSQNVIASNLIGTDQNGNGTQSQVMNIGVFVDGTENLIGGPNAGDRNVISGAILFGVQLTRDDNTVQGNYIGTTASGAAAFGNGTGVNLQSAKNNLILGNVISGNNQSGIRLRGLNIAGLDSSDNVIENNLIGLDATGNSTLANLENGVLIDGTSSFNQRNRITANRIFGNGLLGIKLGSRTITSAGPPLPNDPQDPDIGTNAQQNYPVLASAVTTGGTTLISGSLNSIPSKSFTVEFFSSPACDASNFGEGETFLGSSSVSTDAGGLTPASVSLPFAVATGRFITATTTDSGGNTSEFSNCIAVAARHTISGHVTVDGQPQKNVSVNAQRVGINSLTVTDSQGAYSFQNLPEGVSVTLAPIRQGANFSPPSRSVTVSSNLANLDFAGTTVRFAVTGRITTNTPPFAPHLRGPFGNGKDATLAAFSGPFSLAGVTMTLSGAASQTAVADSSGRYNLSNLLPGSYTLTPSKPNFTFTPASFSFTVTNQNVNEDFTGQSPGLDLLIGRIIYDSGSSIKIMNANGTGLTTLFAGGSKTGSFSQPDLSTDGSLVAGINKNSIFTASSVGGARTNVLTVVGLQQPRWSPNGAKIAFADAAPRISAMNTAGDSMTQVANNCSSPDFLNDNIHVVCSRGNAIITTLSGNIFNSTTGTKVPPRYSPDGTKIAFIDQTAPNSIKVMNADGTNVQNILSSSTDSFLSLAWAPDGTRIAFSKHVSGGHGGHKELIAVFPDGTGPLVITDTFDGTNIDWSITQVVSTSPGTNVGIGVGDTTIVFPGVTNSGQTTVVPIDPASAGAMPNGFVAGSVAFDINTTAGFTPPAKVCFTMPSNSTVRQFNQTSLLHNENGTLVDRTTSRNFSTKQICGQVSSFSPFVLAEQIDPALPSIAGLVLDPDGNPMSGVTVFLTGAEEKTAQTDPIGLFMFANLIEGANYTVQPKSEGVLFDQYSSDLVNVSGEDSVAFTGTPATFQISGRISDGADNPLGGILVSILGNPSVSAVSDAGGNYAIPDLPVDGSYQITARDPTNSFVFNPSVLAVDPLIADSVGLNFDGLVPTAAHGSVSGRIGTPAGNPVSNVPVTLTDANGRALRTRTSSFGFFQIDGVEVGRSYVLDVRSTKYTFQNMPRVISVQEDVTGLQIVTTEP